MGATIWLNVKDRFGIPSIICSYQSSLGNSAGQVREIKPSLFLFVNTVLYVVYIYQRRNVRSPVCSPGTVAGRQQGVNLLAAVSVLITTDMCCKRIAAGNKDTMVSAAVPWCDSIRQEDAYWQGEKGGTDRETERETEGAISPRVSHLGTDAMSWKSTPLFLQPHRSII